MPRKKYFINLSAEEQQQLSEMTHKGTLKARQFKRAMILLKARRKLDGSTDHVDDQCQSTNCGEYFTRDSALDA